MTESLPFPLLTGVFGDEGMSKIFSESRLIESWLEAEAALAGAQAQCGVIRDEVASEIADACKLENIDREKLWLETQNVGYPILPLVRMIDAALSDGARGHVHYGATTQDIMDTGLVLQLREAIDRLLELLAEFGGGISDLVERHRGTPMAARTHAQQAVPTTFGAKLAPLLAELARQRDRLATARAGISVVSLFGAAGTSAALGSDAAEVRAAMAKRLGLETTLVPWHVARDSIVDFGYVCASLAASCARFAGEVIALSRTEIGEVGEAGGHHRGASSTMPQKANPIGSEVVIGMSVTAAALSSALFRAMESGHERPAGEWQVEWEALPLLALLCSGSLANAGKVARNLRVYPESMLSNLENGNGYVMAEAYMMQFASKLGREQAHDLVYEAVRNARESEISLEDSISKLVDGNSLRPISPDDYLGDSGIACDAALAAWKAS